MIPLMHACSIVRPGEPNIQHEFIRAGPVSRRAICRDTIYLELRHHLSYLALALELCPLPVPRLADRLCLLELLVEGAGMTDRSVPNLALLILMLTQ